jgi:hypothetical protein
VAHIGDRRGAYRILVGKPNIRKHLERPWRRWEEDIKLGLQEYDEGVDWTYWFL